MLTMADGDTGVILMSDHGSSNAKDGVLSTEDAESDCEIPSVFLPRQYPMAAETKRNKRKNFQPRNIACSGEDEDECEDLCIKKERRSSESDSELVLDLSSADVVVPNAVNKNNNNNNNIIINPVCQDKTRYYFDISRAQSDKTSSAPIDLSCTSSQQDSSGSESDSDESARIQDSEPPNFLTGTKPPYFFRHPFFSHQLTDASDLKEYARNTVKELLEIYGLNNEVVSDVTQSITNNIPVSNFNSGKILESLAQTTNGNITGKSPKSFSFNVSKEQPSATSEVAVTNSSESPTPSESPHSVVLTPTVATAPVNVVTSLTSVNRDNDAQPTLLTDVCGRQKLQDTSTLHLQQQQSKRLSVGALQTPTAAPNAHKMLLPQNMAAILALASMKEQMKLVNSGMDATLSPAIFSAASSSPSSSASSTTTGIANHCESPGGICLPRSVLVDSPPLMKDVKSQLHVPNHPVDYSRYVKRYSTAMECGNNYCKDLNYREHFHCLDCNSRVFIKKEEMIRHFKWHKKRDESLQHGFMRYSPSDDCSDRFQNCTHNRKQTHYHCIQGTCDKVYISTSDVQMHANYHRKDSAIIQEGFQRLRATEECRTPYCAFYGQKTTHFHCRRDQCQYTFKNKADMEKHKTYHIKDEQLARDGFKKFLKPDPCGFPNCRFSQVCNHIHCVRDGCSYVLHSSGQLLSHKRKHERKDTEVAYRKYKLNQQNVTSFSNSDQLSQHSDSALSPANTSHSQIFSQSGIVTPMFSMLHDNSYSNSSSEGGRVSPSNSVKSQLKSPSAYCPVSTSITVPSVSFSGGYFAENASVVDLSQDETLEPSFGRYMSHHGSEESCPLGAKCLLYATDHFHCKQINCDTSFRSKDMAESHVKLHETQDRLTDNLYQDGGSFCQESSCPRERHYHCTWDGCYEAVLPHERADHLKCHEISSSHYNSLDTLFRRKRGRPPKNRIIEVWNDYGNVSGNDSPQAIFTSFKLPKPSPISGLSSNFQTAEERSDSSVSTVRAQSPKQEISQHMLEQYKFEEYTDGCPDHLCSYSASQVHYHCRRPRCFFATDNEEDLVSHSTEFHENVDILDGFLFFGSSVDCRLDNCHSNKVTQHFHCVRAGCGFSFVQYSQMVDHLNRHQMPETVVKSASADISDKEKDEDLELRPPSTSSKEDTLTPSAPSNLSVTPATSISGAPLSPDTPLKAANTVKASGTFYPLSGLCGARSSSPASSTDEKPKLESLLEHQMLPIVPEWLQVERHERYTTERPCCRAFCKLKRKDHYHCNACNQAFTEIEKLRPHVLRHNVNSVLPFPLKQENNNNEESDDVTQPPVIHSGLPLNMDSSSSDLLTSHGYPPSLGAAMAAAQHLALITSQGIPFMPHGVPGLYTSPSGLMFAPNFGSAHHGIMGNGLLENLSHHSLTGDSSNLETVSRRSCSPQRGMSPEMKKARIQTSMRILKDEPVPDGYLRFRFNEDCRYTHCGYREHQTHFHCVRQDCGYSFCDKTRFVQHTARHERLDTLMGGDFQQYRANVPCGRSDCVYATSIGSGQNKASHFHCLKCEFVCTDTNKVVAHRRQHQKLDSIMAAGFEKFTPSQICSQPETCVHSGKQTHYHCLSCQYAVLGLSQMTAHKYRHIE